MYILRRSRRVFLFGVFDMFRLGVSRIYLRSPFLAKKVYKALHRY